MNRHNSRRISVTIVVCVVIVYVFNELKHNNYNEEKQETDVPSKLMSLNDLDGRGEDDELLLTYARDVLIEPSGRGVPYFMDNPNTEDFSGLNSTLIMYSLLKNKKNGFFVDCGAFDGEHGSVSMGLERDFNWTGLLVDAGPSGIQKIMLKSRKAWFAPTCMSTQRKSMIVSFEENGMQSKIAQAGASGPTVRSLCLPFHTMMKAMGVSKVDLFNLDVEGMELPILKTIDFNLVPIDAMIIEHFNNNETVRNEIKRIMEANGFKFYQENTYDYLFVHSRV